MATKEIGDDARGSADDGRKGVKGRSRDWGSCQGMKVED